MSAEPGLVGRNAPCPCGSGKKYKRCCRKADALKAGSSAADSSVAGADESDILALALDEPAEVAQSWYDFDDEAEVRELFSNMGGVRPDGDGWVLTGLESGQEGIPFAWVRPGDGEVHVISTDGLLLMEARDYIAAYDVAHAVYHVRSSVGDIPVTLHMMRTVELEEGEAADPDEVAEAERDARDLLTTTMRCYYERWIHVSNRALDGRSPLQVAKSKKQPRLEMLHGILTLLDQHEASSPWAENMPYDFAEVWRMLQIDRDQVLGAAADAAGEA